MAREFLLIAQESTQGTPPTTPIIFPTANWIATYVHLDEGNAFRMRPKRIDKHVAYGGGEAMRQQTLSRRMSVTGRLRLLLTGSQAAMFLNWGLQRISSSTVPWPNTGTIGDLASCSIYHAIQLADGSLKRRLYTGVKVASGSLASSGEEQVVVLTMDLVGMQVQGSPLNATTDPTSIVFPVPTDAQIAYDLYTFTNITAGLKVDNATARSSISNFDFEVRNVLDARFFEGAFASIVEWLGRSATLKTKLLYKGSTSPGYVDDRTNYEALSAQSPCSLELNNGTHTVTIGFETASVLDGVDDDLPLDKIYEQTITLGNQYDVASSADFTLTVT